MTSFGNTLDTDFLKTNEISRKSHWYVPTQQGEYVVDLDLAGRQAPLTFKIDHVNSTTVTSNKIEFFTRKSNMFPVTWNVFNEDAPGADEVTEFTFVEDTSVTPSIKRWVWTAKDTATPPVNLPATKRKIVIEFSNCGGGLTWSGP